ncbi:MAG: hypothetical protein IKP35_02640 [Alphaproteobacteria bacterium]|nr:hypothetical protein [Alphaproteobacteria bacterium]
MVNIKQHFEDFRNNTPKHVQWLLMGVAFLVVIILLTLLLTGKSKNNADVSVSEVNQPVSFEVEPETVKLQDIKVGTSSSEIVTISVDSPIVITSIEIDAEGFSVPNDCTDTVVDSACTIKVVYKPAKANDKAKTKITVTWHVKDREENLKTEEIPVLYSAFEEKVEPVEVVEPEQEPEQVEEDEEDFVFEDEPEMDVKEELTQIAVPNPFVDNTPKEVAPLVPPKKCSEFAIPGYDVAGNQIGWIKPEHGANYFYPFADKECANPTGKYNPETGVITSLTDGSKIGTDSDHIGYRKVRDRNFALPKLSLPKIGNASFAKNGQFDSNAEWGVGGSTYWSGKKFDKTATKQIDKETLMGSAAEVESVTSSRPYDRTFILRQFKPIPATIVSEVRADPSVYGCNKAGQACDQEKNYSIPVRATVDRNVYSDDGRTIILPAGTLLMGYLSGDLPGPYQAFGRMNIKWYQFIRPDGVEFNFTDGQDPYSGDAQGRMGVPGHGSTDYVEQMVMPILTSLVPAAVNMIAPITDTVINQIDLDNNTIVQSGTIRSSEMAKQDIINTWNKITQKLLVDSINNTVPPFSIAAGTRINVFSPVDLIVSCEDVAGKKCSVITYGKNPRRKWSDLKKVTFVEKTDSSWIGQIRSFNLTKYCAYDEKKNKVTVGNNWDESGYDYRTVLAYCESQNYQAINNAKNDAYSKNVQAQADKKKAEYGITQNWDPIDGLTTEFDDAEKEQQYNEEVLGLKYDDEGNIINPFTKNVNSAQDDMLTCDDGKAPDENGCCTGEIFTDMGEDGWNCCPDTGGDCFPPLTME